MKKQKRRLKVNVILACIVVILVIVMFYCILNIFGSIRSKSEKEVEILDTIESHGYELNENDSAYFKSLFSELKDLLESEELDEEKYASLVAQLFVTDFYSLDCSINKNDIGGVQFIYKEYQDDFIAKAKSSIYKYVENNIYGEREQELPMVTGVEVKDISTDIYEFGDIFTDEEAYEVTIAISYSKDLGYPEEVKLVIVHSNEKLEIAQME